jgi:type II secretion system protein G
MQMNSIKDKGFTLIELLVVIAIIGLLASVVLVSLNSTRKKARDTRRRADISQIEKALAMYYDKYNAYPVSSPANGCRSDSWCLDTTNAPNWIPGLQEFMSKQPINPTPYGSPVWPYHYTSDGQGYWIMVGLENADSDTCAGGATYYWYRDSAVNSCTWWGGNQYVKFSVN